MFLFINLILPSVLQEAWPSQKQRNHGDAQKDMFLAESSAGKFHWIDI